MKRIALGIIVGSLLVSPVAAHTKAPHGHVPACHEDEVVQGRGDFHSTGYWDRYVCVHPDSL